MLIACPYCGPRDVGEFSYQGDANRVRPDPASTDAAAWNDYVFQRLNTAGPHREYWQHAGGCRAHLVVVRDTTTHAISSVAFARTAPVVAEPGATSSAMPAPAAPAGHPAPSSPRPAARKKAAPKAAKAAAAKPAGAKAAPRRRREKPA